MQAKTHLNTPFDSFILLTEVSEGARLADPIFRRAFGHGANDFGHHLLALYDGGDLGWIPVTYVKYWEAEGLMFSGGACTDGRAIRKMSDEQRAIIAEAGGVLFWLMRFAEQRLSADKPATFACCGDERSWAVVQKLGYERTQYPYLIVRWHNRPEEQEALAMIDQVHRLGLF